MIILAIDPGPTESAWLTYGDTLHFEKTDNEILLEKLKVWSGCLTPVHLAIEMVASYGMPVGEEVFETVFWTGRFVEAWGHDWTKVYRKDVKMHLCNSMRAKDSNIRQAILDKFPSTGGGKTPQVGTKAKPGPLYGIKSDIWSALAVAMTFRND